MAQPSASGFRNCVPVGRDERKAANDKESIEKQRLRDRREEFFHFEEPVPRAEGGVSASVPNSVGWIPESDRFNTDSAYMLKKQQEENTQELEDFLMLAGTRVSGGRSRGGRRWSSKSNG